jgi:hypothetical protein
MTPTKIVFFIFFQQRLAERGDKREKEREREEKRDKLASFCIADGHVGMVFSYSGLDSSPHSEANFRAALSFEPMH